jgi:polysaccharide export outer membrane protein
MYLNKARLNNLVVLGVGMCLSFLASTVIGQDGSVEALNESAYKSANYRIGPGDVIDIVVDNNDVLSRKGVRVSNSGAVQLAMIDGDFLVACQTENEIADFVREKYKKYLLDPRVTVSVKSFESKPVAVIGAVNSPGRFQLQRSMRLLELLTLVNGPSSSAGRTIQLIRDSNQVLNCDGANQIASEENKDGQELVTLPLSETLKGLEAANPRIRAGDVVTVLQAEQAYIYGNVKSAITVSLREPVPITQAIVMAGGLADGAQAEKIKIARQVPGSLTRSEILVNLKEIKKGSKEDVYLQANDLVEIPGPNKTRKLLGDIFRSIVPTITRLPVSVVPIP